MGYTHYWTPKAADDKTWDKFVKACKTLNKNLPESIVIAGGMGDGSPKFGQVLGKNIPHLNVSSVWFNGDETRGEDHETFCIKQDDDEWQFCKTAAKPYDLLVCACLIAAEEILGYEVTSDGDREDWEEAIGFYTKVTGKNIIPAMFS